LPRGGTELLSPLRVGAFEREMGWADDWVLVMIDAGHQAVEKWRDGDRDDGDQDHGEAEPEQEGVLFPLPELAGEAKGIGAGGMNQRPGGEGHGSGVEDDVAETDEGNEEQKLKGVDEVVGQLRGGDVEAEQEGRGEAEDRRAAEHGIDADEQADGDAPGQLFGRGSHAQQSEDGKRDAAVEPVMAERRMDGLGVGRVHVARSHC